MIEQMIFGIDELYEMKRLVALYHSWFSNPKLGTVVLVTITGASLLLMMYGLTVGGRWQLALIGLLGLRSAGEVHHVIRVLLSESYNPGVVTAVPFAAIGALLLYAAYAEMKRLGSTERQSVAV